MSDRIRPLIDSTGLSGGVVAIGPLIATVGIVALAGLLALSGMASRPTSALASADELDLSDFVLTFEDRFREPDIVARGPFSETQPTPRWIAHTPWNGDFGDARFSDPSPDGPFTFTPNGLMITASKDKTGAWRSGLIASVDRDGPGQQGYSQQFGYFEMRAKFPKGPGTWPAFWLSGVDKSVSGSEIDVIEYYGAFPDVFHSGQHVWNLQHPWAVDHKTQMRPDLLTDQFNTFGVLIEPNTVKFYLNRALVWETPTRPEYKQPMYMLANLALGGGWPVAGLQDPATMQIDYIRVYQKSSLLKKAP